MSKSKKLISEFLSILTESDSIPINIYDFFDDDAITSDIEDEILFNKHVKYWIPDDFELLTIMEGKEKNWIYSISFLKKDINCGSFSKKDYDRYQKDLFRKRIKQKLQRIQNK